mmetsp:Transcript_13003/g.23424  ORF Transcript_13003/g.23424 Transcript_13003/m.23424 type:complete len:247 (+) Transcript_13003:54-794(+)
MAGFGGDSDEMGDIGAQIAALGASMGDAPEDRVSQADVNKVIEEALASVQSGSKGKSAAEASSVPAADFVNGKEFLQQGMKNIRLAVDRDGKGDLESAAKFYDKALEGFSGALNCGIPTGDEARSNLLNSMVGYLDRVQAILLQGEANETVRIFYTSVGKNLSGTLQSMSKCGFKCLSRGMELRKRGKVQEESQSHWQAYVLYSEATECFVAYMKTDPKGGTNEAVKKVVFEMLDSAERLKKQVVQ